MRAGKRGSTTVAGLVLTVMLLAAAACGGTGASSSPTSGASGPSAGSPSRAATASSGKAAALTPLHVVYSAPSAAFTPLFVGVDDGIFARAGLNIHLEMAVGAPEMAALKAGEVQVGTPGAVEIGGFDASGGQAVALATFSNYAAVSIYAPKSIHSMAQLAGKTVATLGAGTSPYGALQVLLRRYGLKGKVQVLQVGSVPATLSAMKSGDATAGVLSAPVTAAAAKAGYHQIVNGVSLGFPFSLANVAVTKSYLDSHHATVLKFMQAYVAAWHFVRDPANASACAKAISHWTHFPAPLAMAAYRYFYPVWQKSPTPRENPQALAAVFQVASSARVRALKASSVIDNSLLNQALAGTGTSSSGG